MHPVEQIGAANTSSTFVPIPVAAYCSQGMSFESAEAHLCSGASRVVVPMHEAVRAVVDFMTTGVATGESVIERLSRYVNKACTSSLCLYIVYLYMLCILLFLM